MMMSWSNWSITTLHMDPLNIFHYLLLGLCLVCLAIICVQVFRRYQGKSKVVATLLCAINAFAVITLLLLILPIYQLNAVREQAIVITNNTDEKLLQQAIERYQQSDIEQLFVLVDENDQRQRLAGYFKENKLLSNISWFSSSYQMLNKNHEIENLYIYGDGLTAQQVDSMAVADITLHYFPSAPKLGVIEPKWTQNVLLGASAIFQGKLQSTDSEVIYLVELIDINQDVLAQTTVKSNERFHFNFIPKVAGINTYYLNIRDTKNANLLAKETVQLNVNTGNKINVLVKVASPSFEIRHLKNWLAEQESQLTVISQTSKSASLTQAVNTEHEVQSHINYITSEHLAHFDMLMLDGRTIVTLSPTQQQVIIKAIKQGLALFVFVDDTLIKIKQKNELTDFFQTFASLKSKPDISINKSTNIYYKSNTNRHALVPININLVNKFGEKLVTDNDKKPLVLTKPLGFGSVTLSTLTTSYQWKLSGLNQVYGQYWQYLVGNIIETKNTHFWLSSDRKTLLLPSDKTSLCYFSAGGNVKVQHQGLVFKEVNKQTEPSVQSPYLLMANKVIDRESNYCFDWFATVSGWHQFTLLADDEYENTALERSTNKKETFIYVSEANQWLAWQQTLKQKATNERASSESPKLKNKNQVNKARSPMNKLPLWLIFMGCCSLLWIERKRAGNM